MSSTAVTLSVEEILAKRLADKIVYCDVEPYLVGAERTKEGFLAWCEYACDCTSEVEEDEAGSFTLAELFSMKALYTLVYAYLPVSLKREIVTVTYVLNGAWQKEEKISVPVFNIDCIITEMKSIFNASSCSSTTLHAGESSIFFIAAFTTNNNTTIKINALAFRGDK